MSGEKKKKKKVSARAVESEFVSTHANLTSSPVYRLGLSVCYIARKDFLSRLDLIRNFKLPIFIVYALLFEYCVRAAVETPSTKEQVIVRE